jgi:hypothetical protein
MIIHNIGDYNEDYYLFHLITLIFSFVQATNGLLKLVPQHITEEIRQSEAPKNYIRGPGQMTHIEDLTT